MILLDTCALLDLAAGRLTNVPALAALDATRRSRQAFVPAIVAMEVAQKAWTGKLDLGGHSAAWFNEALALYGLRPMPLRAAVALAAYALPEPFHRDPADRLIVAGARRLRGAVLTCDRKILAYAEAGHVGAMPY